MNQYTQEDLERTEWIMERVHLIVGHPEGGMVPCISCPRTHKIAEPEFSEDDRSLECAECGMRITSLVGENE